MSLLRLDLLPAPLLAALSIFALTLVYVIFGAAPSPPEASAAASAADSSAAAAAGRPASGRQPVVVFYGTLKGGSRRLAERLAAALREAGVAAETVSLIGYDTDGLTSLECAAFVIATYEGGVPPPGCEAAVDSLASAAADFRGTDLDLRSLRFSVFGCGNSEYPRRDFNAAARRLDGSIRRLGGVRVARSCWGDDIDNRLSEQFGEWSARAVPSLAAAARPRSGADAAAKRGAARDGSAGAEQAAGGQDGRAVGLEDENGDEEDEGEGEEDGEEEDADQGGLSDSGGLVDVEDLGARMSKRAAAAGGEGRKKMVSESLRKSLTKQGYKIVGSHSGVKLCRWTKAMLRGRGGCYKHTFYGIASYSCMEATPSLACANKCVFCWRHHDNPVGTSFRWEVDDPHELVEGFEREHLKMVKSLRGVPGILPERLEDALRRVRHCALSLVGEPIIYPRINAFLAELHRRRISTFMVTNAQFPKEMEQLVPCTQLYISIDAPTREQLKAVDRPLFSDFWERFNECVGLLARKRQRTVFRLTLVNGWNDSELDAYAELVRRGAPDLIEVKGVTYCGDSKASPLTIKECPFHHEVRAYCERLAAAAGPGYTIASEHAHSNCVLIAADAFCRDGVWHTWIDYERFFDLYQDWQANGTEFTAAEYAAPTPSWAVYDPLATDGGFDPAERRVAGRGAAKRAASGAAAS